MYALVGLLEQEFREGRRVIRREDFMDVIAHLMLSTGVYDLEYADVQAALLLPMDSQDDLPTGMHETRDAIRRL